MNSKEHQNRVLLFGRKVFGQIQNTIDLKNAVIDFCSYPQEFLSETRLADYDIVIVDYAPFLQGKSVDEVHQAIFEKQLYEALDHGLIVCFVFYDEIVPAYDQYGYSTMNMDKEHMEILEKHQLGFSFLETFKIRPLKMDKVIPSGQIKKQEFAPFLKKWGASYNYFQSHDKEQLDEVISSSGEEQLSFSLQARHGRLLYIPFQRNHNNGKETKAAIESLVDSLLTYRSRLSLQLPDWAEQPFFEDEVVLKKEVEKKESEISLLKNNISAFEEAKQILFMSQYELEKNVPAFFQNRIGIKILREERFAEDFWLLNEKNEKVTLCEVKSFTKGFKKSAIYSTYNHRETNGLEESFSALLIANSNLQSASFKEKDVPISKEDIQLAAKNNVLIIRVEDLCRIWDSIRLGRIKFEPLSLISKSSGWLEVKADGSGVVHIK